MNVLLIIIIMTGFVLLGLGSPGKVETFRQDVANLVHHQVTEPMTQSTEDVSEQGDPAIQTEETTSNTAINDSSHEDENTVQNETAPPTSTPDFHNTGEQEDIPASAVLHDHAPISDFKVATRTEQGADSQSDPLIHKDRHTLAETHAANADALATLDRIASNYQ